MAKLNQDDLVLKLMTESGERGVSEADLARYNDEDRARYIAEHGKEDDWKRPIIPRRLPVYIWMIKNKFKASNTPVEIESLKDGKKVSAYRLKPVEQAERAQHELEPATV